MHKILKAQFGNTMPNIINTTKMNSINKGLGISDGLYKWNTSQGAFKSTSTPSADLGKVSAQAKSSTTSKSSKAGGGVSNMSSGLQQGLGAIGPGLGAASGVVDAIGSVTGLNLDNIDKDAAKRAGISGKAAIQGFINSLPGVSMAVGMFGGKTAKSYKSAEIDEMTSAYGGSVSDINAAQKLSGKRMLGTGKANKFIKEQNRINNLITDISLESKLKKSNSAGDTYLSQNQNKYAGYTPQLLLSKEGMKFPELDDARKLISSWSTKSTETQEPQKYQLGGKMNLIPEGALHARKHNLSDVNPELKDQITNKGIPVVMQAEGGVTQTAEVEKDEWTLRKEFTDELESLYKLYQKDPSNEAAIKAGKLVCYELLKNTDDRSGLIKSIE